MMTHDEMIAVIQHHKDGGKVEWSHYNKNVWSDSLTPCWDFLEFDYRPKPEPMVIFAEVSILSGKIIRTSAEPIFHKYDNTTIKKFIEEDTSC
jgi:hypothetical protein